MTDSLPRRRFTALLCAVLALSLTGCGDIPRPFGRESYEKTHADFLLIPEAAGIYVEPVEGPVDWVGGSIATAMSAALVEQNVVASAGARNRGSYILRSQGYQQLHTDRPAELVLDWELSDPTGKLIGEKSVVSVPPAEFWETPDPKHFQDIANKNAPSIAAWLIPQLAAAATENLPVLHVDLINGEAGDGNAILRQALLRKLRTRGVDVANSGTIPEAALSLKGRIDIKPVNADTDMVAITWRLEDPGAREIGVIEQQNAVPSGSMDDNWLSAAPLIADGTMQGLLPLLRAYERQRIGEKPATKRQ